MKDKVLKSFKKDFKKVKDAGFVESHRSHNTGIGKTFEDLLNVVENNKQEVDYLDELELKSSRKISKSLLTLFTKSPSFPKGANRIIKDRFGTLDSEFNLKIIHTTISGNKFNTYKNKYGFKFEIDRKKQKMFILIKDLNDDSIINFKCYYNFDDVRNIIEKKCKSIALVTAKHKHENNKEFFQFEKAILLSKVTFEKFIKGIEDGAIYYDIRIGIYRSGELKGKPHDHGSGFRIKKDKISEIFEVDKI